MRFYQNMNIMKQRYRKRRDIVTLLLDVEEEHRYKWTQTIIFKNEALMICGRSTTRISSGLFIIF